MLYHLFIAVFAISLLMGGWFIVQAWERRDTFTPSEECDGDVMLKRFSCIGCFFQGHCRKEEKNIKEEDR